MARTPLQKLDPKRLVRSIQWSRNQLDKFSKKRLEALQQLVGWHYAAYSGSKLRVPINLLELAVQVFTQQLGAFGHAAVNVTRHSVPDVSPTVTFPPMFVAVALIAGSVVPQEFAPTSLTVGAVPSVSSLGALITKSAGAWNPISGVAPPSPFMKKLPSTSFAPPSCAKSENSISPVAESPVVCARNWTPLDAVFDVFAALNWTLSPLRATRHRSVWALVPDPK